ncbi:thermonuclease family protein [Altererythrobacter lutimaris]|uniref:Thermonuclease family protein n=1 Tax=Altererythrobacter lutimaris TaxID=2743979 RepID=A0A850HEL7_9SPHN|nr:hypothetical protein [Altererythrobacter lutimaris]NVE95536.1 hypothetical protein [Altererythrobacter lutimaris]
MRWTTPVLAIGLVGAWYVFGPRIAPQDWSTIGTQFGTCGERGRPFHCVSDGDTVTIGYGQNARRIRLTGFDAPEIAGACQAEKTKAILAQRELKSWLNRGPFEWDGGASAPRDQYGRELRAVRRVNKDGTVENLADHMIEKKLASGDGPWEWRDWCD